MQTNVEVPPEGKRSEPAASGSSPFFVDEFGDDEGDAAEPANRRWNSGPEVGRWLAHGQLQPAGADVPYRIQGWLAKRGTSVWFGAGSTGKTQLMLWMAATIASRPEDRPDPTWLGGQVHGTGHVLILTAEDTREQVLERLRDVVTHSMGQNEAARQRTLSRLHVMPFLSMSETEFKLPNPSLLELNDKRIWSPSEVMIEIRRYISEWNRMHPAPEDRIVGVVMDSATSMSGFDSLDAPATTNFFFYLGRLCERLRIFWAVIGHTPKTAAVPRDNARETATSRLRGVAMWTTAPRMTVEVRLIQEWRSRQGTRLEAPELRTWLGRRVAREDLLVVYVAKANLKGAQRSERYLVRMKRGAFLDVTDRPDHLLRSGLLGADGGDRADGDDLIGDPSAVGEARPTAKRGNGGATKRKGRKPLDPARYHPGTALVLEIVRDACLERGPDVSFSINGLERAARSRAASDGRAALVLRAWGGGLKGSRPGSINWHVERLVAASLLVKQSRTYRLTAAPDAGSGPIV